MVGRFGRAIGRGLAPVCDVLIWGKHPRFGSPKSIPPRQIERILFAQYGLQAEGDKFRARPSDCVASAVWAVETDQGAAYVKLFRQRDDQRRRLQDEVDLYRFLNKHGIRAPQVVPASQNRDIVEIKIRSRSYYLIVMHKEQTRRVSPGEVARSELEAIGNTFARMHRGLMAYPCPFAPPKGAKISIPTDSLARALDSSSDLNMFTAGELVWVERLSDRLTAYLGSNLITLGLSETLLHGI
jgi:hypothetical protein